MSENTAPDRPDDESNLSTEEYGSLTVEDNADGTVDAAELANTSDDSDHAVTDPAAHPDKD